MEVKIKSEKRHHYFSLFKKNLIRERDDSSFRNQSKQPSQKVKKKYYHQLFSCVKNDVKMTWNAINEVLKPNPRNNKSAVRSLVFNNETYSDELEHFSTVVKKLHDSMPIVTTGYNSASYLADIPSQEPSRFALVYTFCNRF